MLPPSWPIADFTARSDINKDGVTLTTADLWEMWALKLDQVEPAYDTLPMPGGPVTPAASEVPYEVRIIRTGHPPYEELRREIRLVGDGGAVAGFLFHLEYDTTGLELIAVEEARYTRSWWHLDYSQTITGTTASLHITGYPWSLNDQDCEMITTVGFAELVRIFWQVTTQGFPFERELRFAWSDCADNSVVIVD